MYLLSNKDWYFLINYFESVSDRDYIKLRKSLEKTKGEKDILQDFISEKLKLVEEISFFHAFGNILFKNSKV